MKNLDLKTVTSILISIVFQEQDIVCFHFTAADTTFDFLTQQFVEGVSCSAAVGLRGQQRDKGDILRPLQAGGDPTG